MIFKLRDKGIKIPENIFEFNDDASSIDESLRKPDSLFSLGSSARTALTLALDTGVYIGASTLMRLETAMHSIK